MNILRNKIKIIISIVLIFSFSLLMAQNKIDTKKAEEINTVKSYIQQHFLLQPVSPDNLNVKDKSEIGDKFGFNKPTAFKDRKHYFMNGNNIKTEVYNYGGIAPGYGLLRGINNLVWRGAGYIFQFCPLVGSSVPDGKNPNQRIHIISDGLYDYPGYREVSPVGDSLWGWEPLPGYADPNQEYMASNPAEDKNKDGRPDSWPQHWYNPVLGKYVWPGYLSQDATNADQEVFWAMDDRYNSEFPYYPFTSDSSRRGIGIQIDGRALQWSNALAENCIFFVYTITNVSEKDLDSVYFGIYGDPDVGMNVTNSPENKDDNGFFIPPYNYDGNHDVSKIPVYARSLVYFWDQDMKGDKGVPLGYLGCKFLESPGKPDDGIDNDGDGMIDEKQDNNIDDDHDWIAATDDVGVDGVPGTNDIGEGDGIPTAGIKLPNGSLDPLHPGEPNFELTDLDEADQIGLTSFNSFTWSKDKISEDESMWNRMRPQNFGEIQQNADITFIFGSGPISLKKGETKRISMALLLGENLDDLLVSSETVQRIYNANYRFFRPPIKPKVTAVPDNKKVTLYWDSESEKSVDPITGEDFEGYVIYRSTDPDFNDIKKVTDGRGAAFLYEPLRDITGYEAKWDVDRRDEPYKDLNNNGKWDTGEPYNDVNQDGKYSQNITDWWKGYHPIPYLNRGIQYYLGNNSGLVHSFTDTNNVVNGQTYYYAVCSYDHGDSVGIPPTETSKKITLDPITNKYMFDDNTVQVIPGPRNPGYIAPFISDLGVKHLSGISTGIINVKFLNDMAVQENASYKMSFADTLLKGSNKLAIKNYTIIKENPIYDYVTFFDTNYTKLSKSNLVKSEGVSVKDKNNNTFVETKDFVVDYEKGLIRRTKLSAIDTTNTYTVAYKYYPVYQSPRLNLEDGNDAFDGIRVQLKDYPTIAVDTIKTKWIQGNTNMRVNGQKASVGRGYAYPGDFEISFSKNNIDTALIMTGTKYIRIPVKYSVKDVTTGVPQPVWTYLKEVVKDSTWQPGEEIVIYTPSFKPGVNYTTADTTTWGVLINKPSDTTVTPINPTDGDVMFLGITRPFTTKDVFSFQTKAAKIDDGLLKSKLDKVYVVPNPYIAVNDIEPTVKLPGQTRGERRVYFENLPPKCTIRIYTLSGDHVQTLYHESTLENGREFWNLLNKDGFSIAYGVYLAHIDAPGIGETIIKFAIIK